MIWVSDQAIGRLGGLTSPGTLPELPDFSESRYRLIEELDRGGMGVVYGAEDLTLAREVAIKVLRTDVFVADAAARIEREALILAKLEHPGIVPVHDAGTLPDGRAWYAMKRIRGTRLDHLMASPLTLAEALRLFTKICEPVGFAHARHIVHRDLKPENVMVGESGEVLVLDWGIAKILAARAEPTDAPTPSPSTDRVAAADERAPRAAESEPHLTSDGDVIGTHGYMPPEQERGDRAAVGPASDVWALGTILRELATSGCAAEGIRLPKPLAAIITKATAATPAERYLSAADLAADVTRFIDARQVLAYREPAVERLLRWLRTHRTAVAVIAAYLVMRTIIYLAYGR